MTPIAGLRNALSTLVVLILCACGGGGDEGPSSQQAATLAGPSALSYPSPAAFTVGVAIAALTPSVTGTVSGYSVSPNLPAGLMLNATTGVITGTPTTVQATNGYQVTASNSYGATTATLALRINDAAPAISYPKSSYAFTTDAAIPIVAPSTTGGAVAQWSIDRALPAGLSFDTTNGHISGTPTQLFAATGFVVTAQNNGGVATFSLTIEVRSGVLLDLGHAASIKQILVDGARTLTADYAGHVALWDATTGERIASFDTDAECDLGCIALAGATFAVKSSAGIDLRLSSSGARIVRVTTETPYRWSLAADGGYLVIATRNALTVWSATDGTQRFSRPGNYLGSQLYAAAGEVRVANGPAGTQFIEKLAVPAGVSSNSSGFPAPFHSWFTDGERFLTLIGNAVAVYSKDGLQLQTVTLPSTTKLAGQGNWFWTRPAGLLNLYALNGTATPVASYAVAANDNVFPAKGVLAIGPAGTAQVSVIDLSGAAPLRTDHVTATAISAFDARSTSEWYVGTGTILRRKVGSAPFQRFNLGAAVLTASAGRIAIVTTDSIRLYDGRTLAPQGEAPFRGSSFQISDDGAVLAARAIDPQNPSDHALRVYALPSLNVLNEWHYTDPGPPRLIDHALSGTGTRIAQLVRQAPSQQSVQITGIDGTPIGSDTLVNAGQPFRLSPDGDAFAITSGTPPAPDTATHVYVNGVLTSTVAGSPVGWIADHRLLINRYARGAWSGQFECVGSAVVDRQGLPISQPTLPIPQCITSLQPVSPTSFYSRELNQIRDAQNGAILWSTTRRPQFSAQEGAVTDEYVVFTSGAAIRVEPR